MCTKSETAVCALIYPAAPSYNRFVELKPRMLLALMCYLNCVRLGRPIGLYYGDSTALKVCHNRRIRQNRVFSHSAKRGQTSVGWFYGFKLFLVVNGLGEIVQAFLTPGNVADGATATIEKLFRGLSGLAFARAKGLSTKKPSASCLNKG